jgi:hypothetical protein
MEKVILEEREKEMCIGEFWKISGCGGGGMVCTTNGTISSGRA